MADLFPRSPAPTDRRPLLIGLLLVFATCAVFGGILSSGFVRWDDDLHVYANPNLHPVSPDSLARLWAEPYQNLYIPVSYTLYALLAIPARLSRPAATPDGLWIDLDPRLFHAASLGLHIANVLLVFALLRRLLPRVARPRVVEARAGAADWAAGAGALLFAIHPVQVESVAWISEMRGLLAGLFSLLALRFYLRGADGKAGSGYALATGCFLLALLSKPSAVSVPLLVLGLELILQRPARIWGGGLAAWGLLTALFVGITHAAQPVTADIVTPLWTRPFVAGDALLFYAGKLVWPAHLGIDYGRTPTWLLARPWFFGTTLAALAFGGAIWTLRRRAPALTASASLFLAALLPTLGLTPFGFQVYSTVADRYEYLALLGPALGLSWGLAGVSRLPRPRIRGAAWGASLGLLLLLGLAAHTQTLAWRGSVALFTQALIVNPQSWGACNNLAAVAIDVHQPLDALPLLAAAVRLRPGYAEAHANRGIALLEIGHPGEAEREFRAALREKPDFAGAQTGLGDALMAEDRSAEAAVAYRQALALDPEAPQVRAALRVAERAK